MADKQSNQPHPDYVSNVYTVHCKGRNYRQEEVLEHSIRAEVEIYQRPPKDNRASISSIVHCNYAVGGHGHQCSAAKDALGEEKRGSCPYAFDLPDGLDNLLLDYRASKGAFDQSDDLSLDNRVVLGWMRGFKR